MCFRSKISLPSSVFKDRHSFSIYLVVACCKLFLTFGSLCNNSFACSIGYCKPLAPRIIASGRILYGSGGEAGEDSEGGG